MQLALNAKTRPHLSAGPDWFQWAVVGLLTIPAIGQGILVAQRGVGMFGYDFTLYMDATRRWLSGGAFYPPEQVAGQFSDYWGQILYPPHALALFVPFTVLPSLLWFAIPPVVTLWVLWVHRPKPWAVGVILLLLTAFPLSLLPYIAGTPTTWIVMFAALSTIWPWTSALVWFKPSVFPFALAGIRDKRWWIVSGLFAVSTLAMLPLVGDWIATVTKVRGTESGGLLYSLENVPLLLIPWIATWGSRSRG